MRRWLLVFSILFIGVASGCATTGSNTLATVVETGKLRVGMSGEQPPLNMTTRSGEVIGLEPALARVLASNMGVEVELVTRPFPELLDALDDGEIDLVMSGMTITPRRNLRAAFVGPYFVSGKSVLTKSTKILSFQTPAQLNDPEFVFAALAGSTSEEFVKRLAPNATLKLSPSLDTAVRLVVDDEADALVADLETCLFAQLRFPNAGLTSLREPLTVEPIGIALRPDDPLFVNLLTNYLLALERTQVVERSLDFWLSNPEWLQRIK